jgi:hypothetical protein
MPKTTRKQEAEKKKKKTAGKRDIMKDRPEKEKKKKESVHERVERMCDKEGINDPELRAEIHARHDNGPGRFGRPLDKKRRSELELLTLMYCDFQMGCPLPTDLEDFLYTYMSQSRHMVKVTTYIEGGRSVPDVTEYDIMPIKAYEFLDLVKPIMEDVDIRPGLSYGSYNWNDRSMKVEPAYGSTVSDKKWLAKDDTTDGFWHSLLEEQEDWDVYYYFLDHYNAEDRDPKTLAMWNKKHPRPSWANLL